MKELLFRVITEPPHQIHYDMGDESWQPLLSKLNLLHFWGRVVGHGAVMHQGRLSSRLVSINILAAAEDPNSLITAEHDVAMVFRACGFIVEDILDGWERS